MKEIAGKTILDVKLRPGRLALAAGQPAAGNLGPGKKIYRYGQAGPVTLAPGRKVLAAGDGLAYRLKHYLKGRPRLDP